MGVVLKVANKATERAKASLSAEDFERKYGHKPVTRGYAGHLSYGGPCVKCGVDLREIIKNVPRTRTGKPKGFV